MAVTNDTLKFTLEVKSGEAKKAVDDLKKSTDDLGKSLKTASGSLSITASTLTSLKANVIALNQAWELASRVMIRMQMAIDSTVGAYARLQFQTAKVTTLLTQSEMAQTNFFEAILRVKRQFGGTTENVGYAFYEAIASGATNAAGAVTLVDQANKLAVGGATDLQTALHALSGVMMSYGFSAEETSRINDILFIGAREGKTSIQELAREMGPVLAIAKNMNVGFDELISVISTVSSSMGSTADAVTSVRSAIVALGRQTDTLTALFHKLGKTIPVYNKGIQAAIKERGFVQILKDISKESGGSAEAILKLMERIEALTTFNTLTGKTGSERFTSTMKDMTTAANAVGETTGAAVGKMSETITVKLAILRANIEELFVRIGATLVAVFGPAVVAVGKVIIGITTLFREMANVFSGTSTEIWTVIGSLIAAFVALKVAAIFAGTGLFGVQYALFAIASSAKAAFVAVTPLFASLMAFSKITILFIGLAAIIEYLTINIDMLDVAVARMTLRAYKNLLLLWQLVGSLSTSMGNLRTTVIDSIFGKDASQSKWFEGPNKGASDLENHIDNLEAALAGMDSVVKKGSLEKVFDAISKSLFGADEEAKKLGQSVKKAGDETKILTDNLKTKTEMNAMISKFNELINQAQQMSNSLAEWGKSEAEIAKIRADFAMSSLTELAKKMEKEALLTAEMRTQLTLAYAQIRAYQSFNSLLATIPETYTEITKQAKELAKDVEKLNSFGDKPDSLKIQKEQIALAMEKNTLLIDAFDSELATTEMQERSKATTDKILATETMLVKLGGERNELLAAKEVIEKQITQARLVGARKTLDAIKGGSSSMVEFVGSKFGALGSFFAGIITFFNEAPDKFDEKMRGLLDDFNRLPVLIINNLPIMIKAIVEKMPDTMHSIMLSLAGVVKLIFNKRFWTEVAWKFFEALWEMLVDFKDGLLSIFTGKDLKMSIGEGVSKGIESAKGALTGLSEQLFSVRDVGTAEGRGEDPATKIRKAFDSGGSAFKDKMWQLLMWAGKVFWPSLLAMTEEVLFRGFYLIGDLFAAEFKRFMGELYVWGDVFMSLVTFLGDTTMAAFEFIDRTFFQPFIQGLIAAWEVLKQIGVFLWDIMESVFNLFKGFLSGIWDFFSSIFDEVFQSFYDIGDFFAELFQNPVKAFEELFTSGLERFMGIVTAIGELFSSIGGSIKQFVIDIGDNIAKFITGIGDILATFGTAVWDSLKKGVFYLGDALAGAGEKLLDGLRSAWEKFKSVFAEAGTAIFDALWKGIKNAGSILSNLFTESPKAPPGTVEKWMDINIPFVTFAEGGMVPGRASVKGDSSRNDTIPALLSPGEFVIPRSVLAQNKDLLYWLLQIMNGKEVDKRSDGGWAGGIVDVITGGASTLFDPNASTGSKVGSILTGGLSSGGGKVTGQDPIGALIDAAIAATVKFPEKMVGIINGITGLLGSALSPTLLLDIIKNPVAAIQKIITDTFESTVSPLLKPILGGPAGEVPKGTQYSTADLLGMLLSQISGYDAFGMMSKLALDFPGQFASGGLVGTDTTPAMLTPGEFVMRKPAVDTLGLPLLNALNSGKGMPGGSGTVNQEINVTLNIKTEQPIDENFVRSKLMPEIEKQLRRSSLDGRRVLAPTGVR